MPDNEIELWGGSFLHTRIKLLVTRLQEQTWEWATYRRCDALVSLDGRQLTPYTGEPFEPSEFQVVEHGWTHDHCGLCNWSIGESDDPRDGTGYTGGKRWLCTGCFERFFS
ncbi:hypothetical protein [Armatimonas sp.]|uniref:hypothetical protein n=1 Tax=Armatimonas sp. TaxID=1872638 RepID=UPI00286C877E|nr:hypothetical protein [Armatimonas sp.]